MLRSISFVALGALVLAIGLRPSDACGPDFPTSLLTHRADTVATLWSGSFLDEVTRLVPPPPDATPALEAGDVPTEIELATYQQGADEWHDHDLARADRSFRAVLGLPPDQRRHRSTWAAFMLKDWALLHRLIREGYYDERYLAAFQLGELARHELHAGEIVEAVHLYAQQAAAGDHGGALSLLFVVRAALHNPTSIDRLLADDVGLHLLVAYYYTRTSELGDAAGPLWPRLRERVAQRGVGLDLAAAAAYRDGAWDDAATFAKRAAGTLLGRWVLAKLALRDGDTATAERLLAQVEAAHPNRSELDQSDVADPLSVVRGELGLVALAREEFPDALAHFRAGGHHTEASYVAERVLTVEEVRAHLGKIGGRYEPCWADDNDTKACWERNLSTVLGRRLMRAGRYDEAVPLLDPVLQKPALDLAAALRAAQAATDPIDRAEQLFAASRIARRQGLELLGTEHAPDWAMYGGDYSRTATCLGAASDTKREFPDDDQDLGEGCIVPTPADMRLISPAEIARFTASAPADSHRFHYRYLASQLAEAAADLVPPRSQAFAELLCHAARYVQHRDPDRGHALWKRYVHDGAAGFSGQFGESCDPPDFAHARTFERDHPPPNHWPLSRLWAAARRRWKWFALVATLLAAALFVRNSAKL